MPTKTLKKPIKLKIGNKIHTIKKISSAPDKNISRHGDFSHEFIYKIFGVKGAYMTDESSMYDFDFVFDVNEETVKHQTEKFLKKIKRIYKVDVSDIKHLYIHKILDKIKGGKNG
jgi:hypothetical protein